MPYPPREKSFLHMNLLPQSPEFHPTESLWDVLKKTRWRSSTLPSTIQDLGVKLMPPHPKKKLTDVHDSRRTQFQVGKSLIPAGSMDGLVFGEMDWWRGDRWLENG